MWNQEKYQAAIMFAAQAHLGQTFPGRKVPYLVHLAEVSMEIMRALPETEGEVDGDLAVQAALLHDSIEDTETSYETVAEQFGTAVADGVQALSKNSELQKSERMADSLRRILATGRREIAMVKLADRITNLQDPPSYWDGDKKRKYQAEAQVILDQLGEAHAFLAQRLAQKIAEYPVT